MRHQFASLIALCSAVLCGTASAQTSPADTLRIRAARLAGCYQFDWHDSLPRLTTPLPTRLQLKSQLFGDLGYHRLGFFAVHPAHLQRDYYVMWRPVGGDSLEIELMASPVGEPTDVTLLGQVTRDTLSGVVLVTTYAAGAGQTLPGPHATALARFAAQRTRCL